MWKKLKKRTKIKIDIQSLYIYEEGITKITKQAQRKLSFCPYY